MSYPDHIRDQAEQVMRRYPQGRERSALLPLLHLVQSHDGYISEDGIAFCAEALGLTKAQVQAVSTFYTMYKREPAGDWLVSVCTNTLCQAKGGQKVFDALADDLDIGHDESTPDGKFTLEHAECLAACDYAPVVTVNYEFFDNMDEAQALELVHQLKEGKRPIPSRGAPLCTLREMSVQLAGFEDEREVGLEGNAQGDATLAGARLAAEAGITAPAFDPTAPLVAKEEAK
ncbi:NADH-quinone oxidoreductase subunit NuoE [Glycomyces buryatensis]|uniref:NADH-quinone oxidoreductase subunit NuoE n=1 Tax=Glycomyces buryatensis TaxID=2570927 RepID=A0A4S8QJA9_9ACTN|nr:NADH-quinone oxidoreductase subunit NuoE [Glycomyces buryatensis]THV40824.1 NADH-quinone oxidoreductase subunit NuoE [Glycomyces buryatensis]